MASGKPRFPRWVQAVGSGPPSGESTREGGREVMADCARFTEPVAQAASDGMLRLERVARLRASRTAPTVAAFSP